LNLDMILWLIGLFAELGVVALCVRGRLFRITPVFCGYLAWCLLNDILLYFLHDSPNYYGIYTIEMVIDSVFQFAVLVELGWAVLRPLKSSLPRHTIAILTLLFVILGALIWPISAHMLPSGLKDSGFQFVHAQQTIAVLRVVIFMALAGFSQLLAIGWRNRELQIATGLGFYSMCSLAISVIHSHQSLVVHNAYYHVLDQIGVAAYVCSMIYWIVSFAQQEEARQEFTPQMRSFLLAMTGSGRTAHRPG
jgi:hypothetical protein